MDAEKVMMQKRIDNLCEQLEIVKRERDALKRDLYFECQDSLHACYICKFGTPSVAFCERAKERDDCFVWRGLCEQNGGIEA